MVFSSPIFLFWFLPLTLAVHFALPRAARNTWLLFMSLLFYGWGEPRIVFLMLGCVGYNYAFGLLLGWVHAARARRWILAAAITANLVPLVIYKYTNFLVANLNDVLGWWDIMPVQVKHVALPIGISFFTFQAMSYTIDVYRRETPVQYNPFKLALYVALYPQLIAGPIVRYHDIALQLAHRIITLDRFADGIRRFLIGLGKKVLIANTVARVADAIFAVPAYELGPGVAWLGLVCYTLQIYFDFSGYSDMAIGLGRMVGFEFLENFEFPYIARSIREFWRRWHISLSTWFRDYLYIPLGGNRGATWRTYFNLLLVFFLCGLWHGASWSFVVWGLYHGLFLVAERTRFGRWLDALWQPLQHVYVLLVVMLGWCLFRAETLTYAVQFLGVLGGAHTATRHTVAMYLTPDVALALVCGIVGSMPVLPWLQAWWETMPRRHGRWASAVCTAVGAWLGVAFFSVVLILCAMFLASGTYNPFIYFRF
jgi:alginate O-acetyltransferase complex protein AlgI